MITQLTQQEIVAYYASHHKTFDLPRWSGNVEEWPVCTKCGKNIFYTRITKELDMKWACVDKTCEMG